MGHQIGIHSRALLEFDAFPEPLKTDVADRIAAYPSAPDFFVRRLAEGVATIAAAFAPSR